MTLDITYATTLEKLKESYKLAYQLYELTEAKYLEAMAEMMADGYRLVVAHDDGKLVGLVGFEIRRRLYCSRYMHIHNLIIDGKCRKQGIALDLLAFLKDVAAEHGCKTILADTYIENAPAQALFKKEGFITRGYHLKCDLN